MANLVKWWKQFRQYKVINECSTDSEELIHSSECDEISMQQQHIIIHPNINSFPGNVTAKSSMVKKNLIKSKQFIKDGDLKEENINTFQKHLHKRHSIATIHKLEELESKTPKYNKISCDVSLEDAFEKSNPMNFTFTLYDLEGHGIITKDDITSIVSTIYDSIGKAIVAPLYSKKVINVKLTMSPQDIIKNEDHIQNIKNQTVTQKQSKNCPLEPEFENIRPVIKLKNEITSQNISKNCENFEDEKNNIYESINNLKSFKAPTENNLSKSQKTENNETKNCVDSSTIEQPNAENHRNEGPKNHIKCSATKKRNIRKFRNQKQKLLEKTTRGRSLSVGNEYRKQNQNQMNMKINRTTELNNGSKLRRNELIEIIRESMEKNKLCFQQNNRKTPNTESFGRQRSNTITMMQAQNEHENNFNQCNFDSILHSTLCGKIDNSTKMKQIECLMTKPLTLKTSLLNQLNPVLTPEQKLARKLNDIEKWLVERESATKLNKKTADKNVLNQIKYDKLSSEVLYDTRNSLSQKVSTPRIEKSQIRCPKLQKDAINNIKNKNISAYPSNIYLDELEKLRECENLITSSETEDFDDHPVLISNADENSKSANHQDKEKSNLKSSGVRFVHIHHHYYHFDSNKTNQV